jgi:hypothetical protein
LIPLHRGSIWGFLKILLGSSVITIKICFNLN